MIRGLELLSPISQAFRKEKRAGDGLVTNGQWFNWSCLCNDTSIETPKQQGSESFQVGGPIEVS